MHHDQCRLAKGALLAATCAALFTPQLFGGDWISVPSYYSHAPQSGQRVQQYSPVGPFYTYQRGDFRRSGYRQTRSSIQAGGSADHMHVVEEWGGQVRPYGEWRFPYRPYSVPYDQWGPPPFAGGYGPRGNIGGIGGRRPFAGRWGPGLGGPGAGAPGPGAGGGVPPAVPPRAQPYPGYLPQPWDDGRYPRYDSDGPYGYPDLLIRPSARGTGT